VYAQTGYWAVQISDIMIWEHKIVTSVKLAIVDTGTSLLIGPKNDVHSIFSLFIKKYNCAVS